jgi:tetratricopeptide (TPR) repeat protein
VAGEQAGWLLGRASTYLRERGQYRQARPIAERALTITKEALGPADPETAWRHEELGSVLQALGDLAGAKAQLERALAIGEAALGPDHPAVAAIRVSLAGVLGILQEQESGEDPGPSF